MPNCLPIFPGIAQKPVDHSLNLAGIVWNFAECRLMFSSRGSYLLFRLCSSLVESLKIDNVECVYWLSSRDAIYQSSSTFIDYCQSFAGRRSVFVDLTGSGVSLSRLKKVLTLGVYF